MRRARNDIDTYPYVLKCAWNNSSPSQVLHRLCWYRYTCQKLWIFRRCSCMSTFQPWRTNTGILSHDLLCQGPYQIRAAQIQYRHTVAWLAFVFLRQTFWTYNLTKLLLFPTKRLGSRICADFIVRAYVFVRMCACIYEHVCVYIQTHIHMHTKTCMYVYMCVHIQRIKWARKVFPFHAHVCAYSICMWMCLT